MGILPARPYDAVLTVERRISQEGMVAVGGNQYSVPDTTRRRIVEVQNHPTEVRIFEDGTLIACHPVLEGKNQSRSKIRLAVCRCFFNWLLSSSKIRSMIGMKGSSFGRTGGFERR
jgi:hypothetical protein